MLSGTRLRRPGFGLVYHSIAVLLWKGSIGGEEAEDLESACRLAGREAELTAALLCDDPQPIFEFVYSPDSIPALRSEPVPLPLGTRAQ